MDVKFAALLSVLSAFTVQTSAFEERSGRANLLSFSGEEGKDIGIALDFELPFLNVPIKRTVDKYGNEPALLNINTGAVVLAGLFAGGGLVVGHLFRTLFPQVKESDDKKHNTASKEERFDTSMEESFLKMFEPFKLVYRNTSGGRVETTMPSLFRTIEDTLLENDINLAACLHKSICSVVNKAGQSVLNGGASGLQKIIEGATNLSWLMGALAEHSALREAVDAGKMASNSYCDVKYPTCKWSTPEQKLEELMNTYVKFT